MKTLIQRVKIIAQGGVSRLIISFSNVIVSFMVVRTQSATLWGEVVVYLLILETGFSLVSWGSSPFLLREFSLRPKDISHSLSESLSSRSALPILFSLGIWLMPYNIEIKLWLTVWVISRFVYQSFEPLIQFHRHFIFSSIVEILGLLVLLMPLLLAMDNVGAETMVFLYSMSTLLKGVVTSVFLRQHLLLVKPTVQFFFQAFPFLILTFSGMVQQRADLYSVAVFLGKTDLARYQVFINLLIFAQFTASLLLSPFAKNIFRLPHASFLKLERKFIVAGIGLSGLSIFAVYVITHFFYQLEYSLLLFGLGYFYVLMFYLYLMRNYLLGKQNKQLLAASYSLIVGVFNFLMSCWFIPNFGLEGALTAGLLAQALLVVLYFQNNFNNVRS